MPGILCHHCGYDLSAAARTPDGRSCPECGKVSPERPVPLPWWMRNPGLLAPLFFLVGAFSAGSGNLIVVTLWPPRAGGGGGGRLEDWILKAAVWGPIAFGLVVTWRLAVGAHRRGIPGIRWYLIAPIGLTLFATLPGTILGYLLAAWLTGTLPGI